MTPRPAGSSLADVAAALGVRDTRVLAAMREVPRVDFVPLTHADLAERDVPVPIGHGQVTTQPSLVAAMIEALALQGTETVLEVGTGWGYQTALLARLVGSVWTIERRADLLAAARANLARHAIGNVRLVRGDGSRGLPEHAPFDAILVSAASPRVPPPLVEQLVPGGRLVQPIGPSGDEDVTLFVRVSDRLQRARVIARAHFVPLVGAHGVAGTPAPEKGPGR